MKWVYGIQQKIKTAFLLAAICLMVLVGIFWERSNVASMEDSTTSIYDDRLLPATYVFHLTDHLYQKRLILESYFEGREQDPVAGLRRLAHHDAAIDTLIEDFEATYLVENEDKALRDLKRELEEYSRLERSLLQGETYGNDRPAGREALETLFAVTRGELIQLSRIQIDIGKQLKEQSRVKAASVSTITKVETVLIILISLIIQALVFASKTATGRMPQQHELN